MNYYCLYEKFEIVGYEVELYDRPGVWKKVKEIAEELGVSYNTLREWFYHNKNRGGRSKEK